jgi:hypothetical protein
VRERRLAFLEETLSPATSPDVVGFLRWGFDEATLLTNLPLCQLSESKLGLRSRVKHGSCQSFPGFGSAQAFEKFLANRAPNRHLTIGQFLERRQRLLGLAQHLAQLLGE